MPLAALANLQNEEFVKVESGFQNFVLVLVFPQAYTPTTTLVVKVGVEMCVGGAWQTLSLNPPLYLEFLA